jgi:hypothetical protein
MTHVLSIDVGKGNYALCVSKFQNAQFVNITCLESWCIGDTKATPASGLIDRLLTKCKEWHVLQNHTPNVVLIEQQMRGAHINLALAFASYAYFNTRFPHAKVKFVPPANKFKFYEKYVTIQDPSFLAELSAKTPLDYTQRKRYAVKLAQAILKETQQPNLETFTDNKKKMDDLADAFLQSFCF